MADTLPKGYEPHDVEARWRDHWQDNRTFTPDPDAQGEPFSIVIPPPNVTGALHIGHALNQTLIDVLCRHARQKGKNVLWVPGTDHAGIATQNVVERALAKEGKTRQDLGREAFIERVWQWREDYGHRILNQIRALGASVDWTRLRFTMDEGLSAAVRKVFDLRPAAIIDELDLKRPIYLKTAAYGHFGRTDVEFPWEKTNKVEELKAAIAAE